MKYTLSLMFLLLIQTPLYAQTLSAAAERDRARTFAALADSAQETAVIARRAAIAARDDANRSLASLFEEKAGRIIEGETAQEKAAELARLLHEEAKVL